MSSKCGIGFVQRLLAALFQSGRPSRTRIGQSARRSNAMASIVVLRPGDTMTLHVEGPLGGRLVYTREAEVETTLVGSMQVRAWVMESIGRKCAERLLQEDGETFEPDVPVWP